MLELNLKEGKTGYCFLNSVVKDTRGHVALYQVVINIEYSFETKLYYLKPMDLKLFREKYKDRLKFDFSFDNSGSPEGILVSDKVKVLNFPDTFIASITDSVEDYTGDITSIYDLILDVVDCDGLLFTDEAVEENIDRNTIELGIANFSAIRISKSTMTIACSIHDGFNWTSKKLLAIEDGRLRSFPFYFAVDTHNSGIIDKYKITRIGEKKILNRDVTIYKWEEQLPIYRHTRETLKVFDSLTVRYCYNVELLTTITRACERMIVLVMKTLNTYSPLGNKDEVQYTNKYNRDRKYGVTFQLNEKAPSIYKLDEILQDTLTRFGPRIKAGEKITVGDILGAVRSMQYPKLYNYAYYTYVQLLTYSKDIQLDMIDYANQYISDYSKQLLFSEIYLYSLRASIYISNYSFGHMYSDFPVYGSDVNYNVTVRRCIYESELQ